MKKHKKTIIFFAILLLIITSAVLFFFVPGAWFEEVADISPDSHVMIRQSTHTQIRSNGEIFFVETITDYDLNAEQIEMLKAFIQNSNFTRSLRSILLHPTTNLDSYNTYDIFVSDIAIIRDENSVMMRNGFRIGISWGYFSGFRQSGNGWIKISNSSWEDSIMQILALS